MTDPTQANAPPPSGDAARLTQALRELHRRIGAGVLRSMQGGLQDHDLTFAQMMALHGLRAGAPLTVSALAAQTRLSLPATSHLVERLVRRGLAERRENPDNRREKLVAPTPAGLAVVSRMDTRFVEAYAAAFRSVPPPVLRAAADAVQALVADLPLPSSEDPS
ncbi:MarR family transcriptional regulator [Deinococcus sp. RL]|uniref:MarR family winged helix-turn-helix transcriptional regulator n=1 Tax=Deinococcus sp. RL TaxID=1489678 RepID=UPI0004D51D7D|nr:MarR family transcriptional regulator [Deinococcus sp. RL]KEF35029.1 MarR family transcriptional regulator [Deinococcus sp. RL]